MIWIILFVCQFIDAVFNNWYIHKFGTANHRLNAFIRIGVGLALIMAFHVYEDWALLVTFGVGAFFGYMVLFNTELNWLRQLPLMTEGTTSVIDNLKQRWSIPWEASTAWTIIIVPFCIYAFYNHELLHNL